MGESDARSMTSAVDSFLRELIGCLQRFVGQRAPRHHGDVIALAQDEGLVQRQGVPVIRHILLGQSVQPRWFKEDHGIRFANRRQQQAVGARGR